MILKQCNRVAQHFDGSGVIGDREFAGGDAGVGPADEGAREDLRSFHGPQAAAVERAQAAFAPVLLDGVGHAVGEDDSAFAADDLVERDELLLPHERPGAVVDENMADVVGQLGERGGNGILALGPAAHEDARRGRIGGEFH